MDNLDKYIGILLNTRRDNERNKFPCSNNDACCGICDNFYPCLFDLLRKIKSHAIKKLKEQLKREGLEND